MDTDPASYGTMRLPALCESCGAIFPSSYALRDSATTYMEDCTSGPCPRCGGTGLVPNGAYTIVERVLAYSRDGQSREDMIAAVNLLGTAIGPGGTLDVEMLERRLPQEAPTVAGWVMACLRDPAWSGVGGLAAVAAILISVLMRS